MWDMYHVGPICSAKKKGGVGHIAFVSHAILATAVIQAILADVRLHTLVRPIGICADFFGLCAYTSQAGMVPVGPQHHVVAFCQVMSASNLTDSMCRFQMGPICSAKKKMDEPAD